MAAIVWVGSMIFTSLVVQPVLRQLLPTEQRLAVYQEIGRRYRPVQWGSWSVLLATGGQKLWRLRGAPEAFRGGFGRVLGVKLALVLAMGVLSLLHAYRWGPELVRMGPRHPGYRAAAARMAFWGAVNLGLLGAIVLCGALLRFGGL